MAYEELKKLRSSYFGTPIEQKLVRISLTIFEENSISLWKFMRMDMLENCHFIEFYLALP